MQRQLIVTSRSNRSKVSQLVLGTLALVFCYGGAANTAQARPDIAHAGSEGRVNPYLNPVQTGPAKPQNAPAQTSTQTTATAQPIEVASLAAPADAERYAQREAKSQDLLKYRGGDAIIISASTLVIVLLVALLIVLLT